MQFFHEFKYKFENKLKVVRGKNAKDVAYFTNTKRYKNLYDTVNEQNGLDVKIHQREQRKERL